MTETARELWWPHHPSRNRETALAALDSGDTGEVTLEYADFAAIIPSARNGGSGWKRKPRPSQPTPTARASATNSPARNCATQ